MPLLRTAVLLPVLFMIIAASPGTVQAQAATASTDPVGVVDKLLGTANFIRPNQAPAAFRNGVL